MLVACCLANRTNWHRQSRAVFVEIRRRWPSPFHLGRCDLADLVGVIRPLGLYTSRAKGIRDLAKAWWWGHRPVDAADVVRFPACGQYASDSWAIFVEGRRDLSPSDGMLKHFLERDAAESPD